MSEILKKACDELDGKMKDDVCMVDGFPMGESSEIREFVTEKKERERFDVDWELEKWKPEKFLRLTGWNKTRPMDLAIHGMIEREGFLPAFNKKSLNILKDRIKEGKSVHPPWIRKWEDDSLSRKGIFVPAHEGRHRSLACMDVEKCKKIPVVIIER